MTEIQIHQSKEKNRNLKRNMSYITYPNYTFLLQSQDWD